MSKNPFSNLHRASGPIEWSAGKHLDFDQSSIDPRFRHDQFEEDRRSFNTRFLVAITFFVAAIYFWRLFGLQVLQHESYRAIAEGNSIRVQYISAPRGLISDAYGKVIVQNRPSFELAVIPLDLPSANETRDAVIRGASEFFGIAESDIRSIIESADPLSFNPVTVRQAVSEEQAIVFATRASDFPGFTILNEPLRYYLSGPVTSHIVGYTGKVTQGEYETLKQEGYLFNDIVGKEGLESVYEKFLRGIFGQRLVEVDARGVVKTIFQEQPPVPGADASLFLDMDLQEVLYNAVAEQAARHGATRAAAVALDPRTGGVLALVSYPGYDNNWFAAGITPEQYRLLTENPDLPLFNRVTAGIYPPGSTIKPFVGPVALQEGIITEKTKIVDNGHIIIPNVYNPSITYTFRSWKPGGFGALDVYGAIQFSSDVFFYTVGGGQESLGIKGMGPEKLAEYLQEFYLGRVTGIDLPTERAGLMPTPEWKKQRFAGNPVDERWFLGDTYNMSIGQGFMLVTPLQLAVATASLANGGAVYRPHLVREVVSPEGESLYKFTPEILNRGIVDDKYIQVGREAMRRVVTDGTARSLNSLAIPIAGKTGTSQFDGSDPQRTHAWFTSFAPYENPKIVLTVLIEAGGDGSSAAVPVARTVYDWYSKNR